MQTQYKHVVNVVTSNFNMQNVVTHNNPCNPKISHIQAKSTEFFLKNPAPAHMKNPAPENNSGYEKSGTCVCKIRHLTTPLTTQICMKNLAPEKVYKKVHEKEEGKPIDYQIGIGDYNGEMYRIEIGNSYLVVSPEHGVYVNVKDNIKKEEDYSFFLFLRSDQSKENLTLNSLNFVSILNNSTNTPPSNISVIGGEPIIPSNFNMMANTANAINPQAIIPNILSSVSLFIYLPSDLFINNPIITPETMPINTLNVILNSSNRLSTAVTTTTTVAPPKIVLYSFDNIDKNYLNGYIKVSFNGLDFSGVGNDINQKNKEKNGFHSLVIVSDKNPMSTRTRYIKQNLYKNFTVYDNLAKLGSHSLVIAPDLKSGILPGYVGSNSLSNEMDFPPLASINNYENDLNSPEIYKNKKEKRGPWNNKRQTETVALSRLKNIKQNLYKNISKTKENIDGKLKENPWVLKGREVIHYEPEPPKLDNIKCNNYINVFKKEKKNGSLNQVEQSNPRTICSYLFAYLNVSFLKGCKATDAQSGRALALRASVPKDMRVQNSNSFGVESPVRGAQSNSDLGFLELKCGDNIIKDGMER